MQRSILHTNVYSTKRQYNDAEFYLCQGSSALQVAREKSQKTPYTACSQSSSLQYNRTGLKSKGLRGCNVKTIYALHRHTGDIDQLDCSNNSSTVRHEAFLILYIQLPRAQKKLGTGFCGRFQDLDAFDSAVARTVKI